MQRQNTKGSSSGTSKRANTRSQGGDHGLNNSTQDVMVRRVGQSATSEDVPQRSVSGENKRTPASRQKKKKQDDSIGPYSGRGLTREILEDFMSPSRYRKSKDAAAKKTDTKK